MGDWKEVSQALDLRFSSGNSISIERASIKADEWTTIRAHIEALEADAAKGRGIARQFLPIMEAMRPLVLNLERLKDATKEDGRD